MTTEHTPGPWAASRDAVPEGHVQITVYEEATGRRVATVFEREANAPLLATAPELLDACIRARDWLEIENENCYCRELDEGVCLLCELESVINKAGGEP